jgi:uncharacterized protein (DUF2141 family)
MSKVHRTRTLIVAIAMLGTIEVAEAQHEFVPQGMAACTSDIIQYCPTIKRGNGRVIKCLLDAPSISKGCDATVRPADGGAEDLTVTVTINGIHSKAGYIYVSLGDDPKTFQTGRRMVITPATGSAVTVTFRHLKPSNYAVTAFHDENENSKFDAGFTGAEGFAASNGVNGIPTFEKSVVKVSRDSALTLSMVYF